MTSPETEQPPDPAGESAAVMSFWEHLDELRSRLTRAALAYVVAMFAAWAIRDEVLAFLWKPFVQSWKSAGLEGEPQLHFAAPGDAFMAYFKLSMIAGAALAAPIVFYQVWAFIAPGLYKREKRWSVGFVVFTSVFFVGGALFGWRLAFPISFDYFLSLTADAKRAGVSITPTVMIGEYLDFVAQLLLAFGIIFELPILLTFLSMIGLVNYLQLLRFSRWFVMVAAVLGAVLSPPDTTSMVVMTVPLIGLYFVSIGLAWLFGKRPTPEQIERDRKWRAEKKADAARRREERRAEKAREAEEKRRR
ncbi:MAG: twin-arginine translocase subunit TatC [Polyangiaceae bacterium]|nr:twin-arginine translocase subunit TatC [Polyangiaceae bacterium]